MIKELENYLTRLEAGRSETSDLGTLVKWIERNTTDPSDPSKLWSFDDHEYQIDILSDTSQDIAVRKCSQVGMSELSVRMLLGMVAISKALTAIYVLPTAGFARKFSKQRIDPVVDNSAVLKSMVDRDNDSSELKRFGNSFIYINGASGQKAAISIPAHALFQDEVDFCDPTVLTTYASRLRHAKRPYQRSFSTPTVPGYGIDALFQASSQKYYAVKCVSCFDWVMPNFLEDVVVPGYGGTMQEFDKDDLSNGDYRVDDAYVACPRCRKKITEERLADPALRQWVAKYPDERRAGYQIYPYDVIKYNRVASSVRQLGDYERKADWVNFVVGLPYADAETSFLESVIRQNTFGSQLHPPPANENGDPVRRVAQGCVLGMDVGKVSNIVIGMRQQDGRMKVVYCERYRQGGNNELFRRVMFLVEAYGVMKAVVDAGPDFTTATMLTTKGNHHQIWACYYVNEPKSKMDSLSFNEEEQIVKAFRTGRFDMLVRDVNRGHITFAESAESELFINHLGNLKRVEMATTDGGMLARWVCTNGKVGDHYGHALNYMMMADSMAEDYSFSGVTAAMPMIGKFRMKSNEEKEEEINDFFFR